MSRGGVGGLSARVGGRAGDRTDLGAWIDDLASDAQRLDVLRARLVNLGWFMKALIEPLARMANKEDECQGTFWESRYKSIAVLHDEALLATCLLLIEYTSRLCRQGKARISRELGQEFRVLRCPYAASKKTGVKNASDHQVRRATPSPTP